jgi:glycosyltransferase involved in cell wall biosynthesis
LRILIISQYFWPENFRINEIVRFLKKRNYDVDILTGPPNYPEGKLFKEYIRNKEKFDQYYGSRVYRVPVFLRRDGRKLFLFLNYITFIFSSIFFGYFLLRNKKYDIVFSFATSPLTSSLAAIFFSKIKYCRSFIWVLDIWPDILLELKIIKNFFLYKFILFIYKYIYQKFDYILSQSISFKKIINSYSEKFDNNIYFPAWAEEKKDFTSEVTKYSNDNSFNIVFTGNVGEAQNFDQVIKAAIVLKKYDDIKWIIVGAGRELENIKKIVSKENLKNFILVGQKTKEEVDYYHSIATVLFVSLKSGNAISSTIPGKLQTYLKTNKFILGMIAGEGKKIIEESGVGFCVDPDEPQELIKKILYLRTHPEIIAKISNSNLGQTYLNKNFNKDIILEDLIKYFNKAYDTLDKIKIVKNASEIPYDKNFALSGLNLAFLGYLQSKKIKLHKYLLNWPDGIFKSRFYGKNIPKVSGLNLLNSIKIPNFIENIHIIGSLTKNSKEFLSKKFSDFKVIHANLPYDKIENLCKLCPTGFTSKDLIICTLPTPKQEQLSEYIINNNKHFKIICIGGAVAVASGDEMPVPDIFNKLNVEFLWRLRSDTRRRVFRLIHTFIFFIYGELTFRYKRIKFMQFIKN